MPKQDIISFKDFFGFDNPFSLVPEEKGKMIWADQKEIKQKIEKMIRISLMSSLTRLIIYYGDYGSGKTHAMRYFTNVDNIKTLCEDLNLKIPVIITLICPRNQVFNTFYIKIVERVWPKLVEAIQEIDSKIEKPRPPNLLKNELNKYIENENLCKVLSQATDSKKRFLVEKYLLMKVRGTELDKLGVPRGIETYLDMLETLSGIFFLLTELNKPYLRVIIWIDEAEYVLNMPSKDLLELQAFLRDLIDHIPRNLLILLNASFKPGEKIQDFVDYLGDPVKRRISRIISSPEMVPSEAIEYIEDYLKLADKNPFENGAIKSMVDIISDEAKKRGLVLTPGLINRASSIVLETAYFERKRKITTEFVRNIRDEIVSEVFSQYPFTP